jgi:hypothetical protein
MALVIGVARKIMDCFEVIDGNYFVACFRKSLLDFGYLKLLWKIIDDVIFFFSLKWGAGSMTGASPWNFPAQEYSCVSLFIESLFY